MASSVAVDRAAYVEAARGIIDRHQPHLSASVLWPGGGRRALRRLAVAVDAMVRELEALDPPAEDRADLERHFLGPARDFARVTAGRAAEATWFLSAQRAFASLGPAERPDDLTYGLYDASRKSHATFAEHASNAGVELPRPLDLGPIAVGVSTARAIRQAGVTSRFVFGLALMIGLCTATLGAGGGAIIAAACGAAGFVAMVLVLRLAHARAGRSVEADWADRSTGVAALGFIYSVGKGWRIAVVSSTAPDVPVAANIAHPPPRAWRRKPLLGVVVGRPEPDGRFAFVTPGGAVVVTSKPAYPALWPPAPLQQTRKRADTARRGPNRPDRH